MKKILTPFHLDRIMAFIQSCFIKKNTPELRKKLEELGYKYSTVGGIKSNNIVVSLGCIFDIYPVDTIKRGFNNCIDCEANEKLFLALAALRDDTNANQWLTDGKIWGKFDEDSFLHPIQIINYLQSKGHKASIEEIIEHFKDK